MHGALTKATKEWPSIYFRTSIPEQYRNYLATKSKLAIFEPWHIGEKEPIPSVDLSQCEVVFTLGLIDDLSILDLAPNVRWVQSVSVGLDALLNERTIQQDLMITNTKGCTSVPIAEHTLAMMLGFSKNIPALITNQQTNVWGKVPVNDLAQANVCIIGYGQIGYEIAKRCKAFGMNITGCRRHPTVVSDNYADTIVGMDQVDDVLTEADYVVLALPATAETDNFLNADRIKKIKQGAVVINVGRGNAVVEADLVDALIDGHIRGAALDVFQVEPLPKTHPFWNMEQVIVSAHQAYFSNQNMDRIMNLFAKNMERYLTGQPLINQINKQKGY
ncbi:Phosphoglycerate dehydrogenase [Amphibacillus marinus]|uniref:Phosphoglycerate dehydrogenase n=1 Tax=Amphibacillus marinus TaxID=872970 RepID=A0A1H8ITC3_9BACI|nr:D-2-hydroxyacid dehydrogenase [Amphibacillus marinus]SEN71629.1 Phosphoglycerate dehydrogenase [Amphibacillus marinus]